MREATLELPGLAGAGGRGPDLPPAAPGSGLKSRPPGRVLPQPARGAAWRAAEGGSALRSLPDAASGGVPGTRLGRSCAEAGDLCGRVNPSSVLASIRSRALTEGVWSGLDSLG